MAAWLSTLILAEQPAPWFVGSPLIVAVGGETGLEVDDVGVLTELDGLITLQAKGSLKVDSRPTSEFAKAMRQVVGQFVGGMPEGDSCRPIDDSRDRLVVVGDGRSSQPVRQLAQVTRRLRTLPDTLPLASAATNQVQRETLTTMLDHIRRSWIEVTGDGASDAQIRGLLRVLAVDVLDLDDRGADLAAATIHLRSALLDPAKDITAWSALVGAGQKLAEDRMWHRRNDLAEVLEGAGVAVGPGRRVAADVQTLHQLTLSNLTALSSHAVLPLRGGINCPRPEVTELVKVDGTFVIVGDPGCGKSGVIHELARQLIDATEDVVVLTVDNLPAKQVAVRVELGLHHDLAQVLKGWTGAGRGTLVLDGLDAARGEATGWLVRLCESLEATRWRVIASIRGFDVRHSTGWQHAFRGEPLFDQPDKRTAELMAVRHYVLGDLSDDDLNSLAMESPEIRELLRGASSSLIGLVKNPFNLRLAVELLGAGVTVASLSGTRDQLHLLNRYWQCRVTDAPSGVSRERVLTAVTKAMLTTRRLRADYAVVSNDLLPAVRELLHDGVLQESPTRLLAQGPRPLVFSHHILFDYAVARLVLASDDESCLVAQLQADPDLTVIARPSIDLHLADVWHAEPDHMMFASVARDLVMSDQPVAGIAAARTAAEATTMDVDLDWLAKEFEANPQVASVFVGWISGVMDAADIGLSDHLRRAFAVWAGLTADVAAALDRRFDDQVAQRMFRFLWQLNNLDPLTPSAAGASVRAASTARLMSACLVAPQERSWLAGRAAQLLPRAVAVEPGHVDTLRRTLDPSVLEAFGSEVMHRYVEDIQFIAQGDPRAAAEILSVLWRWEEDRDERTHLRQGVLNLSSTRKQDLHLVKWLSGEKFSTFLRVAGLQQGLRVVSVVAASGSRVYPDVPAEPLEAFGATGRLLSVAHALDYGGDDVASRIVDDFIAALFAQTVADEEAASLIAGMVASIDHPELWSRLLSRTCESPAWHRRVAAVLSSGALLANWQTRPAAGRLLRVLSPTLIPPDHAELLEVPIRRAAALFPSDGGAWREKAIDQLLACLDVSRVQDDYFRQRLIRLLEAGEPPPIPEHHSESFVRRLDLRDVLGTEVHEALDEETRTTLDELRHALDERRDNDEEAHRRLAALLLAVLNQTSIHDHESVLELVTRAAERLSSVSFVEPGAALGDLVFRILADSVSARPEVIE